jgi:hypothetical protein
MPLMNRLKLLIEKLLRHPVLVTTVVAGLWAMASADWLWFRPGSAGWVTLVLRNLVFLSASGLAVAWTCWAIRNRDHNPIHRSAVYTASFVIGWQMSVYLSDALGWHVVTTQLARVGTALLFLVGLMWVVYWVEVASQFYERSRRTSDQALSKTAGDASELEGKLGHLGLWALLFAPGLLLWARRQKYPIRWVTLVLLPVASVHFLYLPLWFDYLLGVSRWSFVVADDVRFYPVAEYLDTLKNSLWLVGVFFWLVVPATWKFWQWEQRRRIAADVLDERCGTPEDPIDRWWRNDLQELVYNWNPLDLDAWYYGQHGRKLNQSLTALLSYSFTFALTFLLLGQIGGCSEIYEMPAGGGEQQQIVQQVKVQKVIKRKYIVNPFSAILFQVPPIDDIKLQLTELTHHAYKVGYGQGKGAGYAGGTKFGKVRFIRLEYSGGDWAQDFGIGADLNMLIEYNVRTQQKVHNKTESRTVMQLNNFPVGKSPPMVYLTGQKSISLSNNEVKALRKYLNEKHGMIFGDNGGSGHFHNQFLSMMRRVLPTIDPVPVPLDDVIHRIPYQIPFLPYVAPHGGTVALGWKVDGRWVCYYHPGDIGDAWADGHAGVKPEIFEYCYQLGTNVINYSHAEYSKWLEARKEDK